MLWADDIAALKKIAETKRSKWQVELRALVHRTIAGDTREITILKERT